MPRESFCGLAAQGPSSLPLRTALKPPPLEACRTQSTLTPVYRDGDAHQKSWSPLPLMKGAESAWCENQKLFFYPHWIPISTLQIGQEGSESFIPLLGVP